MCIITGRAAYIDMQNSKDAKEKHLAYSRAVVLNLWVMTPLGVLKGPFAGVTYQIFTL